MSVDSDAGTASASSSRDWYFPSPPFLHDQNFSKYPRRFPETPRFSPVPPPLPPQRAFHHAGLRRRVGFTRRSDQLLGTDRRDDAISVRKSENSGERASAPKKAIGFLGQGLEFRARWKMAVTVAVCSRFCICILLHTHTHTYLWFWIWDLFFFFRGGEMQVLITVFSSLLYQNFSLRNQVNALQVIRSLNNQVNVS